MFFFPITPKGRACRRAAKKLYPQIVLRAREPVFYSELQVPDSFTGRFEMVALHVGLVINRLRREGKDGERMAQALFDQMVLNMDMACRQTGIGDLGVPKQLKKMMTALQGRALTYQTAGAESGAALVEALNKNLYATVEAPSLDVTATIARYMGECAVALDKQTLADFMSGQIEFAPLPQLKGSDNVEETRVA